MGMLYDVTTQMTTNFTRMYTNVYEVNMETPFQLKNIYTLDNLMKSVSWQIMKLERKSRVKKEYISLD